MERALRIPEILLEIFSACPSSVLPACGMTCRAWETPALSKLWAKIFDACNLFNILGRLIYDESEYLVFEDPVIDPNRWERFERYASMVQSLEYNTVPILPQLGYHALRTIVSYERFRDAHSLFPRLTELVFCAIDANSWRLAPIMFSSTLTHVSLTLPRQIHNSDSGSSFYKLSQAAPRIKSIAISGPKTLLNRTEQHLDVLHRLEIPISELFSSLEYMHEVVLDSRLILRPSIWSALSSSTSLGILRSNSLDFSSLRSRCPTSNHASLSSSTGFLLLETLYLDLHHSELVSIFSSFRTRSLCRVHLSLNGEDIDASDVLDCISAITSKCDRLIELTLRHAAKCFIEIEHIQLLLSHSEITRLSLDVPHRFQNADIETVARALPRLTYLRIGPSSFIGGSQLTLEALLPLAEHSHVLEYLTLSIITQNAPSSPSEYRDPDQKYQFKSLRQLNFMASRVSRGDSLQVALFLEDICPIETNILTSQTFMDHRDLAISLEGDEDPDQSRKAGAEWKFVAMDMAVLRKWRKSNSENRKQS